MKQTKMNHAQEAFTLFHWYMAAINPNWADQNVQLRTHDLDVWGALSGSCQLEGSDSPGLNLKAKLAAA